MIGLFDFGAVIWLVLLQYAIGSIPIGYLIGKKFGVNLLEEGSKAIGRTNLERVLVPILGGKRAKHWGYLGEAGDQLKGFLPVLVAILWIKYTSLGVLILGMCLILGHCYSLFLGFKGGKGVATTMGITLAISPVLAVLCYAYWFMNKKAFAKHTSEATALASIRAACLLGVGGIVMFRQELQFQGIAISHNDYYMQMFFAFAALHIIFAHRANLRRYRAEQREKKATAKRIGGDMPTGVFISDAATNDPAKVKALLMQKRKYAWLIRFLPPIVVRDWVLPRLPMKKLKMGEVILRSADGMQVRVITWGYPRTPQWMMDHPEQAMKEIAELADYLESIGANDVCLGANTAVVGDKGLTIQSSINGPITNGNKLTGIYAVKAGLELLPCRRQDAVVTVVGPGGSVGDAVCQLLLEAGIGHLYLVGSSHGKQAVQAAELRFRFGTPVKDLPLMDALSRSHLAIFASSATASGHVHDINPEELPAGLVVVDMERPRQVSKLLAEYLWLVPNDGGMVAISTLSGKAGLGLPDGIYFPCFSELALRLFMGWKQRWCAPATLDELKMVREAAEKLGFRLAGFRLNEKPLEGSELRSRFAQAKAAEVFKPRKEPI